MNKEKKIAEKAQALNVNNMEKGMKTKFTAMLFAKKLEKRIADHP
jgi:hypothetical protein